MADNKWKHKGSVHVFEKEQRSSSWGAIIGWGFVILMLIGAFGGK